MTEGRVVGYEMEHKQGFVMKDRLTCSKEFGFYFKHNENLLKSFK